MTFRNVLGENLSPEKFIAQLEQENKLLPLIHYDECLLGLILGFGLDSSTAFKDQNVLLKPDQPYPAWSEHYRGIDIREPKKCLIFPVGFMGDPHSKEVQNLVELYEQELQELWKTFQHSRNTLQLVLEKLCA